MKITPTTTPNPAFFLGIDVGKTDLFCHLLGSENSHSERFDNTPQGISALAKWFRKLADPAHSAACLEQTGHYAKPVAKALVDLAFAAVHLVNPCRIKAFGNQRLRRNKSDSADARLIAQFIQVEHSRLQPWTPPSAENEQLTELSRYAESLTADTARLKTKCEAVADAAILRSLKRRIKFQETELADIRRRLGRSHPQTLRERHLRPKHHTDYQGRFSQFETRPLPASHDRPRIQSSTQNFRRPA